MAEAGYGEATQDDKLWALLSWLIWIVALIALLLEDKKSRPFIRHNAVQSLALGVVAAVLVFVLSAVTFFLGGCGGLIVLLAYAIYAIILAIQSYQGRWVTVPYLTDFCKKQGWI
ncbi:MAG: DUF4870 domain-containing protein [Anaerolineae bacterium]|nr:DUF4870 domain-containing protein [Anaerolineae bacterium]MDW8069136.1 DUF4870 domain-containing protein [Anaerolineae bacterium]